MSPGFTFPISTLWCALQRCSKIICPKMLDKNLSKYFLWNLTIIFFPYFKYHLGFCCLLVLRFSNLYAQVWFSIQNLSSFDKNMLKYLLWHLNIKFYQILLGFMQHIVYTLVQFSKVFKIYFSKNCWIRTCQKITWNLTIKFCKFF